MSIPPPVDRYEVDRHLTEGGMGAIYVGRKISGKASRAVVLKQLLPEYTTDPDFIEQFKREAQNSSQLVHSNIVQTLDLVQAGSDYFIVMEYVPGADVESLIKKMRLCGGRFSARHAAFVGCETLKALSYAYDKDGVNGQPLRLVHKDISPSNILVSEEGEVKLTDFGIAKAATQESVFYQVQGKVGYMSPEQARGQVLDIRSDLFSLGVTLYEMLIGQRVFLSASVISSPDEIYRQEIPSFEETQADKSGGMERILRKAMAFKREERFQSASEFLEALDPVVGRLQGRQFAKEISGICGEPSGWRAIAERPVPTAGATGRQGTQLLGPEREEKPRLWASDGTKSIVLDESAIRDSESTEYSVDELRTSEFTSMLDLDALLGEKVVSSNSSSPITLGGPPPAAAPTSVEGDSAKSSEKKSAQEKVSIDETVMSGEVGKTGVNWGRRLLVLFLILIALGVAGAIGFLMPLD